MLKKFYFCNLLNYHFVSLSLHCVPASEEIADKSLRGSQEKVASAEKREKLKLRENKKSWLPVFSFVCE